MSYAVLTPTNGVDLRSDTPQLQSGPAADAELLEQFAFKYGRSYDSYLVIDPGRKLFWTKRRAGVVAYIRTGRHLHVGGGLLAPAEFKAELLADFVEFARQQHLTFSFYNVAEDELQLFREFGFQVTKWGEDTLIDLPGQSWSGKQFQWARRQSNYCRRRGLTFRECVRDQISHLVWNSMMIELSEISSARLATKPQAVEMSFLDGRFDPDRLARKRLFIARSAQRIEGFLLCNPCLNGSQWALEVYRQRPDGVRGTIAFLIHQTLLLLQQEGVQRASLCLIPTLRCSRQMAGDSRIIRWGLVLSRYFNIVFDGAGLYHFKSRFRPRYENRYVCVFPKATAGSFWSFVRLCGALELSPRKLLREGWNRLKKRSSRATLAKPVSLLRQEATFRIDRPIPMGSDRFSWLD